MLTAQKSTLSTYSLSTLLLASAFSASAVTARPIWDPPKIYPKQSIFKEPSKLAEVAETNVGIVEPVGKAGFVAPKERAVRTLRSYHPGNPLGDTSISSNPDHIEVAEQIIQSLPAGFPIPWVNRNDDGEVGLYWDDNDAYADIDIDVEGKISFYSKLRSTGEEQFISEITPEEFTAKWAHQHLALLLPKTLNPTA
jgi:hypothetical protein